MAQAAHGVAAGEGTAQGHRACRGGRNAPSQPTGCRGAEPASGAEPGRAGAGGAPRPRRGDPGLTTTLATAAVVGCLLLAGLWLSGYPGAVILTAATALFAVAVSYRRAHWAWYQLSRPSVVAALLLAAAACAAVGGQLLLAGVTGPLARALGQHRPAGHLPGRGGQDGGRPRRRRPLAPACDP